MRRRILVPAVILISGMVGGVVVQVGAQDASASKQVQAPQTQTPVRPYRLDFTLTETDAGKKIDSRQYSINLSPIYNSPSPGGGGRVQVGTRVPIGTVTNGTMQYLEIGTTISASLYIREGTLLMNASCDLISVIDDVAKVDGRPVLRTLNINNNAAVIEGKPILVGTADDPNSNREFQLEVTVTELK